jgi:hypothetical protein
MGWGRWSGYAGDVDVKGLTATLTGALLASVAARRRDGRGSHARDAELPL